MQISSNQSLSQDFVGEAAAGPDPKSRMDGGPAEGLSGPITVRSNGGTTFAHLPDDICVIFLREYLTGRELVRCTMVDRRLRRVVQELPEYRFARPFALVNSIFCRIRSPRVSCFSEYQSCVLKVQKEPHETEVMLVDLKTHRKSIARSLPFCHERVKMVDLLIGDDHLHSATTVVVDLVKRGSFETAKVAVKCLEARPGFDQARIAAIYPSLVQVLATAGKVDEAKALLPKICDERRAEFTLLVPQLARESQIKAAAALYESSLDDGTFELAPAELVSIKDHPILTMRQFYHQAKAAISAGDIGTAKAIIPQLLTSRQWRETTKIDQIADLCTFCIDALDLKDEALELLRVVKDEIDLQRSLYRKSPTEWRWRTLFRAGIDVMKLHVGVGDLEGALAAKENQRADSYGRLSTECETEYAKALAKYGHFDLATGAIAELELYITGKRAVYLECAEDLAQRDEGHARGMIEKAIELFFTLREVAVLGFDDPICAANAASEMSHILKAMHSTGFSEEEISTFLHRCDQDFFSPMVGQRADFASQLQLATALITIGRIEEGMACINRLKEQERSEDAQAYFFDSFVQILEVQVARGLYDEALVTYSEILKSGALNQAGGTSFDEKIQKAVIEIALAITKK